MSGVKCHVVSGETLASEETVLQTKVIVTSLNGQIAAFVVRVTVIDVLMSTLKGSSIAVFVLEATKIQPFLVSIVRSELVHAVYYASTSPVFAFTTGPVKLILGSLGASRPALRTILNCENDVAQ